MTRLLIVSLLCTLLGGCETRRSPLTESECQEMNIIRPVECAIADSRVIRQLIDKRNDEIQALKAKLTWLEKDKADWRYASERVTSAFTTCQHERDSYQTILTKYVPDRKGLEKIKASPPRLQPDFLAHPHCAGFNAYMWCP